MSQVPDWNTPDPARAMPPQQYGQPQEYGQQSQWGQVNPEGMLAPGGYPVPGMAPQGSPGHVLRPAVRPAPARGDDARPGGPPDRLTSWPGCCPW